MKRLIVLFFICITLTSIYSQSAINIKKITVYIFLSETCPICQSYTLKLKELHNKYYSQNVEFTGVFSNYYANTDSIKSFKEKYSIPFNCVLDKDGVIAKQMDASITPQVVVVDENNLILYSGRIDDTFYRIGKRRQTITSNDLEDVLQKIINNQKIENKKTQAVGCIISFSK